MANKIIIISGKDNVAVALEDLKAGAAVQADNKRITLLNDIPFGHKVALYDIAEGQNIIKYGQPIGYACAALKAGEHIHTHNLKTNLSGVLEYAYEAAAPVPLKAQKPAVFFGYRRKNGAAGIRNEIWIIPTVGCVNMTAASLARKAGELYGGKIDGVHAFTHNMGCSQLGDDHRMTQHILKGLINNPNAGGVLVLSLGCENNNLESFLPVLGDYDKNRVKFLITQNVGDEHEEGLKLLGELAAYAAAFKREEMPADKLVLGFKCGGSDAFSGITANPLCGRINDILVSQGGSTILTEVPEMFGAETLLMKRAADKNVFDKTVNLINNFKNYFIKYNQTVYENPSPGNKKGGISSLEEKSLGCTQKGGFAPVVDVLESGDSVLKNGLNLLTGPGNDQISCTNLAAAGAQMILFTTGRGNPYGAPVPTVKISSNSDLYNRKKHWIDFNAGRLMEGAGMDELAEEFYKCILDIASGRIRTKNEINGYREISIFRDGVIL